MWIDLRKPQPTVYRKFHLEIWMYNGLRGFASDEYAISDWIEDHLQELSKPLVQLAARLEALSVD